MKRFGLIFLFLFIMNANSSLAQNGIATIQVGAGIPYGGLGAKITLAGNSIVGLTAGVGNYNGPTLSWGSIDNVGKFNKETVQGFGFAVGLDVWYTCNFYSSLQFIGTGSYNDNYYGKIPLYGVNWTVFGGWVPISGGIFVDFACHLAFLFPSKVEEIGGMFGLSIGIGYMFGY